MGSRRTSNVRVYEPRRAGMIPFGQYLSELWDQRRFIFYVSRAELKSRHFDTWFGQAWTVFNPLLLAAVYFLLINVVSGGGLGFDYFAFIIAGLFAFFYTRHAIGSGSNAVVQGGGLVTSTTLPRAVLPLSAVMTAFLQYMPTLLVYAVIHVIAGLPVGPQLLALPLIVLLHTVFNAGLALGFSTAAVYMRDVSALLPYVLRIWMYMSPVLFRIEDVPDAIPETVVMLLKINPLYPLFTCWHQVLSDGRWPDAGLLLLSVAWTLAAVVIGGYVFLTKEREFAVRI